MTASWPPPSKPPLLLEWSDETEPAIEINDFVEDLLVGGSLIVFYGESNSGKTFTVTDLALHVAAGMNWRDRDVEQGADIYVTMEGTKVFKNRLTAWRNHHNVKGPLPFAVITSSINLLQDTDVQRLIAAIREAAFMLGIPVKLIVIDTLNRALSGGSETDDMGKLIINSDLIRKETDAAVLFIHHSGKDAAKGARGSSQLRSNCDTEGEVTVDDNGHHVTIRKQRDLAGGDVFDFGLRPITIGTNRRDKPITSCIVFATQVDRSANRFNKSEKPNKQQSRAKRLLEIIRELIAAKPPELRFGTEAWQKGLRIDDFRKPFYDYLGAMDNKTKTTTINRTLNYLQDNNWIKLDGTIYVPADQVQRMNEATTLPVSI